MELHHSRVSAIRRTVAPALQFDRPTEMPQEICLGNIGDYSAKVVIDRAETPEVEPAPVEGDPE